MIEAPLSEVDRLEGDLASAIAQTLDAAGLSGDVELAHDLGDALGVVLASWGIWASTEGTILMERPSDPPD